ncbi:MAG: hypothetical protein E7315_05575 [Clostridiales bacterium]|nr:hypothetical protein [Clostridiales bacterium]
MSYIIGFDTSCYTTSVAISDENGKVQASSCRLLATPKGERGLRQETALFSHIKALPNVIEELFLQIPQARGNICAVGVSAVPRRQEGSYLPVFEAGHTAAHSLASSLGVPCYNTTHQEGHIEAALYSCGYPIAQGEGFISLHLSGGTTELLLTEPQGAGYKTKILSATTDLNIGQFVDRIGVKLGCSFPAGKELSAMAVPCDDTLPLGVKLYNGDISLSGAERAFGDLCLTGNAPHISYMLFMYLSRLLAKWIGFHCEKTGIKSCVFAGGVSSNNIIRENTSLLLKKVGVETHFADPQYCTDNAMGVSLIAARAYKLFGQNGD